MNRRTDWFRWIMMAVLAVVAVYFFLFANSGIPQPPVPSEGTVKDPILASTISNQIHNVNQSPTDLGLRLRLCMIYDANGLDTLAMDCYEQLTELVPDHPRAWYQIAHLHQREGDADLAMENMQLAASKAKDAQLPNWQLGQMQIAAGRPREALQTLELAREQLGDMPEFLLTTMQAHVDVGNHEKVIEIAASNDLVNSSVAPYVQRILAQAHEQLGNETEAANARLLAAQGAPQLVDSWMVEVAQQRADLSILQSRIAATMRAKKWAEAMNMLDLLHQYEKPSRETKLMEITCMAQSGSPEEALQKVEVMMADSPGDQQLILAKAAMQLQIGDLRQDPSQYEFVIEAVEPILDDNPGDLRAMAIYLRGLRLLGRTNEALAACRAAWASQPQQIGPLLVAADLIRTNDAWAGNDDLLRSLWMAQPNHPTAGAMLALSLAADGRVDEARMIVEDLNNASLDAEMLNKARDAVNAAQAP
ncbi:MAG: hypothetical protein P8M22_02150 [Phycisphaerales bacterium]|nr:hypothetical protein [Phycisphaerales bacterium]